MINNSIIIFIISDDFKKHENEFLNSLFLTKNFERKVILQTSYKIA